MGRPPCCSHPSIIPSSLKASRLQHLSAPGTHIMGPPPPPPLAPPPTCHRDAAHVGPVLQHPEPPLQLHQVVAHDGAFAGLGGLRGWWGGACPICSAMGSVCTTAAPSVHWCNGASAFPRVSQGTEWAVCCLPATLQCKGQLSLPTRSQYTQLHNRESESALAINGTFCVSTACDRLHTCSLPVTLI